MKKFLLLTITVLGYLAMTPAHAATNDFACTMEYAPVCAKVQVQCVTAPCYPVYKTYGNSCTMSQDTSATFVHMGECKTTEVGSPVVLSERLKAALKAQYDAYVVRITGLSQATRLAKLELIDSRIVTRLNTIAANTTPLTLAQQTSTDRVKAGLTYLQDLIRTDISYLKDEMSGMRYISRDANMCMSIRFYCAETEVPFFGDKGCGCKK